MYNLFAGMLLVFLDFNLSINGHTIGLLPDFLGFWLMKLGLAQMAPESEYFSRARPFAFGMMIYTAAMYVLDILAVNVYMAFVSWALGLLATIANLVIGYWVVLGVTDMEQRRGWTLEGPRLKSMWLYLAILQGIAYVCSWIPMVGAIGALAAFIIGVCFLAAFYKSMKLYQEKN